MNGTSHLLAQNGEDTPLPFNPRQTGKFFRNNTNCEMRFAMAAIIPRGAGMAGMAGTVILDIEQVGREFRGKLVANMIGNAHRVTKRCRTDKVKQ